MSPVRLLTLGVLLLQGCTTIGHREPPADWPKLAIYEHRVSTWAMLRRCYPHLSLPMKLVGGLPFACSEINFEARRCDIFLCEWTEWDVLDHEYDHCLGRDHFGDSTLGDAWAAWKAENAR